MNQRLALTVEEAAEAAGVSRTTIFLEVRKGRLTARKVGRRTLVAVCDLEQWISSLPGRTHARNPHVGDKK